MRRTDTRATAGACRSHGVTAPQGTLGMRDPVEALSRGTSRDGTRARTLSCSSARSPSARSTPRPRRNGCMTGARPMVSLDAPAPDFEALTTQGERLRLSALRGRPVVLFFFPGAFTPVCTQEAKQFGEVLPQLRALGAEVVGVSTDTHEVQCDFAAATGAAYPMVGDPSAGIARSYDVEI